MNAPTLPPQIIRTEAGDELVVLTRRTYDGLLARAGDEAAEDRMTAHMADDHLEAVAEGRVATIPHWFAMMVAEHGSTVMAARKHAGLSRSALAQAVNVTEKHLREIERDRSTPTAAECEQIASATGVNPGWLV